MSYTKLELDNILHFSQRRTKPRPQVGNMYRKFHNSGRRFWEKWVERQTHKTHTDTLITVLCTPAEGGKTLIVERMTVPCTFADPFRFKLRAQISGNATSLSSIFANSSCSPITRALMNVLKCSSVRRPIMSSKILTCLSRVPPACTRDGNITVASKSQLILSKFIKFTKMTITSPAPYHNHFTALFRGPPGWASAKRELLDFMVQGKINRGRHRPAGWAPLHPD